MKLSSVICLIYFISNTVYAETDISGFIKLNYLNYQSKFDSEPNNEIFQVNRVSILSPINDNITLEGSYQVIQIYSNVNSSEVLRNYDNQKRVYRIDDFNSTVIKKNDNYYLNHNFDRATVTWNGDTSSVVFGRQQLAFGSAKTVNPTDIFTPFSFTAIDTEVRNGVDAFRFRHQLGEMGQYDVGVVLGENADRKNSAAYGLIKFSVDKYEIKPMVAVFQEAHMGGLDLETSLLGASIWFENAWVDPKNESGYFRSVLGGERQITPDTSMFIEYHYNGAGETSPSEYYNLQNNFAYQKGGVFLLGKNYLNAGSSIQITPLHRLDPIIMTNFDDKSLFLNLSWEWNAKENFYFNLGSFITLGKTSDNTQILESEFGSVPSTIFTRIRYYF
ncbi:MAG: hypothetical protein NXH75_09845 [Halobacteriovoraceae bacterium]|jgi:hypothetical protein|nr:hypothetical protein [Halobacteriovorax sp.]MBK25426.1 hypothetical protein [Halobacteriovorax sp.]MCR9204870.1 hypothetical protein [Halobacteriovoraceae bacterium]|tara:strand:- start:3626 stop:4792 length:1167 start_codon:yes stop_codon:yes gene_type:complete